MDHEGDHTPAPPPRRSDCFDHRCKFVYGHWHGRQCTPECSCGRGTLLSFGVAEARD